MPLGQPTTNNTAAAAVISSDTKSIANNTNTALLIEGIDFLAASGPDVWPDIRSAVRLAEANNLPKFDCVSANRQRALTKVYAQINDEQKNDRVLRLFVAVSAMTVLPMSSEHAQAIKRTIKDPFQAFVDSRKTDPMPTWLEDLTIENCVDPLCDREIATLDNMLVVKRYNEEHLKLYNQFSCQDFNGFLDKNSHVNNIFGLVGRAHLPMIDSLGQVIAEDKTFRHIRIIRQSRVINVYLFGSTHGLMDVYWRFADCLKSHGFEAPLTSAISYSPYQKSFTQFLQLALGFEGEAILKLARLVEVAFLVVEDGLDLGIHVAMLTEGNDSPDELLKLVEKNLLAKLEGSDLESLEKENYIQQVKQAVEGKEIEKLIEIIFNLNKLLLNPIQIEHMRAHALEEHLALSLDRKTIPIEIIKGYAQCITWQHFGFYATKTTSQPAQLTSKVETDITPASGKENTVVYRCG